MPATTAARRSRSCTTRCEQLGDGREVLLLDEQPGIAQGARHAGRRVGDHRHVEVHRLEQWHAEALVLGEAEVGRRQAVVRAQLGLGHAPREHHVVEETQLGAQLLAAGQVGLGVHRGADDDQPAVGIEPAIEVVGLDEVLHALVRSDAAHEEESGPPPVRLFERPDRRVGVLVPVDQDREHAGLPESRGLQLPSVELRDAERQLGHGPEARQLPAAAPAAVGDPRVDADEVLGRRDVVVDQGAPVAAGSRRSW